MGFPNAQELGSHGQADRIPVLGFHELGRHWIRNTGVVRPQARKAAGVRADTACRAGVVQQSSASPSNKPIGQAGTTAPPRQVRAWRQPLVTVPGSGPSRWWSQGLNPKAPSFFVLPKRRARISELGTELCVSVKGKSNRKEKAATQPWETKRAHTPAPTRLPFRYRSNPVLMCLVFRFLSHDG